MKLGHAFASVSGWGRYDVYGIAQRFPEDLGFQAGAGESWIFKTGKGPQLDQSEFTTIMSKSSWFTGIWRSRENKVYVTDISGCVLHGPCPTGDTWPETNVGFTLDGVWGLDDQYVYIWGSDGKTPTMAQWNGTEWRRIDSPDFDIVDLHGIASDLLVAVGSGGKISRWDGSSWIEIDSGTRKNLSSVFVASPDEMYACGHHGALLQGSVHGWQVILEDDIQKPCVAKWRDEVYVGTYGDLGLCKLEGGQLVSFKPKVQAMSLEVRGKLVALMSAVLVGTDDGNDYQGIFVSAFENCANPYPPLW